MVSAKMAELPAKALFCPVNIFPTQPVRALMGPIYGQIFNAPYPAESALFALFEGFPHGLSRKSGANPGCFRPAARISDGNRLARGNTKKPKVKKNQARFAPH